GPGLRSGLLAALAYLCRSIGVTVVAAVLLSYLLRRKPREALLSLVFPVLAVSGWELWKHNAADLNAKSPSAAALTFDLDSSAWLPRNPATVARIAGLNASATAWSLLQYCIEPEVTWLDRAARADPQRGDLLFSIAAVVGIGAVLLMLAAGVLVTL